MKTQFSKSSSDMKTAYDKEVKDLKDDFKN